MVGGVETLGANWSYPERKGEGGERGEPWVSGKEMTRGGGSGKSEPESSQSGMARLPGSSRSAGRVDGPVAAVGRWVSASSISGAVSGTWAEGGVVAETATALAMVRHGDVGTDRGAGVVTGEGSGVGAGRGAGASAALMHGRGAGC